VDSFLFSALIASGKFHKSDQITLSIVFKGWKIVTRQPEHGSAGEGLGHPRCALVIEGLRFLRPLWGLRSAVALHAGTPNENEHFGTVRRFRPYP
jgi:hypothetical protein